MLTIRRSAGPLLLALMVGSPAVTACGGSDGGGGADGGIGDGGGPDGAPAVSCDDGDWVTQNASNTPGTISHGADLVITAGGIEAIAWTEPGSTGSLFDEDLFVSTRVGSSWAPAVPVTADTDVQNAFPSLVADGETLHLVWNGYPEGLNDLYYSTDAGAGWSPRVNLTSAFEGGAGRHAYSPSLAIGPSGQQAVAYLSAPASMSGGYAGPSEVRVASLDGDALAGAPVMVIPAVGDGCFGPRAVYDRDGALHVIADCGPLLAEDIYYASDASGGWTDAAILPGSEPDEDDIAPSLALGGDGLVHVAWVAGDRVLYLTRDGTAFGTPVQASDGSSAGDSSPTLAVDQGGDVTLAFQRRNPDDFSDVYVTTSTNGAAFSAPCNLTRSDAGDEQSPRAMRLDPSSGAPHLTYEAVVAGSDPLDVEIMQVERLSR